MTSDIGLVLTSVAYRETSRIATIFFRHSGLLSLISRKGPANLTSPLCLAEFLYTQGRGEVGTLREGRILNMHLPIRASYDAIDYASKMARMLIRSQQPGEAAPRLFDLTCLYLAHLPENPRALYTSFILKLIKHEGVSPPLRTELHSRLQAATSLQEIVKKSVSGHEVEEIESLCRALM